MIDIHCHILYGVDDGADTLDETLEMAKMAYESGTRVIAVTPHSNTPGSRCNFWGDELKERFIEVKNAVKEAGIPIQILSGQEIFGKGDVAALLRNGDLITLNGSRYPLIEFPFTERSENVFNKLESVIVEGYVPIVAHPERYYFASENFDSLLKIKEMGCLLQINTGSVEGKFGRGAKSLAMKMLKTHTVDIVASDAHSPFMRTTDLSTTHEYICGKFSTEFADRLFSENPKAVLQNKII